MEKLKKNTVFRFLSSVKLAVPLMFVVLTTVAYGTIVESRYNTDMARLTVYRTVWFQVLLALLFTNILFAALSRIPWRKHHIGFVITHLGMLTLLTGAMITNIWGIDGQLKIEEKGKGNDVILSDLVLELINTQTGVPQVYKINRSLREKNFEDFKELNDRFSGRLSVVKYLPFAEAERGFKSSQDGNSKSVALSFRLKSAFFDVTQWLQSDSNPEMQMGPAHLSLVVHEKGEQSETVLAHHTEKNLPKKNRIKDASLEIYAKDSGALVKTVLVKTLKEGGVSFGSLTVNLTREYQQAIVGKNKLSEGGEPGQNPALELNINHSGQSMREVLYTKFPTFTLHPQGLFGFTFRFVSRSGVGQDESETAQESIAEPAVATSENNVGPAPGEMPHDSVHAKLAQGGESGKGGGNQIKFHAYADQPDKVRLELIKGGRQVLSQWVEKGGNIQTPWMGLQIFLNDVVRGGTETQEVKPIELALRTEMPPTAVLIRLSGGTLDDAFWLIEGEAREFSLNDIPYQVYFGRETLRLPFKLFLDKFTKLDYPGTQTPMSFESMVKIEDSPVPLTKISMNEPMDYMGYTLYQASYVMGPGLPTASVFSVNRDPGRPVKYAGSLILVSGILIFTLMRSRLAKLKRSHA